MSDEGRLPGQPLDDLVDVIGDLSNGLAGENVGVCVRLGDGRRIVRSAWGERGIASVFEHRSPAIPAAGQEPEAVDKHDWRLSCRIGAVHLLLFMFGDCRPLGGGCLGDSHCLCPFVSESQAMLPADRLGGPFADDYAGRHRVARGQAGQNRTVRNAKLLNAVDLEVRADD